MDVRQSSRCTVAFLLVGVGDPKAMSAIRARKLGGKVAGTFAPACASPRRRSWAEPPLGKVDEAVFLGNIALGARLRDLSFRQIHYSAAKKGEEPAEIDEPGRS